MEKSNETRKPKPNEVRTDQGQEWKGCVDHPLSLKSHWYSVANSRVKVFPPNDHRSTWVVMVMDDVPRYYFRGSLNVENEAEAFKLATALIGVAI